MLNYIKKHWFLISFVFLLVTFLTISVIKITVSINLSNLDNQNKTNIILTNCFKEIDSEIIEKETEIMFNKYNELGYDLKNVNYNVILKTILPIYSKYKSYSNIQNYISNNKIEIFSKEEFIKFFHSKELTLEEKIITDYFYYLYQTTSAINYYKENNTLTENTDIEDFIEKNYENVDETTKQYYKTYLKDNLYEQNFFESLQK